MHSIWVDFKGVGRIVHRVRSRNNFGGCAYLLVFSNSKPDPSPKMSKYRRKPTSLSNTPFTAFRGAAPATPRKSSTQKKSSIFPTFSTQEQQDGFDKKMDKLYGRANISYSEGTVEEEFERYKGGASPRETDIIQFWAVSFP